MPTSKPTLDRVWANAVDPSDIEDPDITSPGKFDSGWGAEKPAYQNFNWLQQYFSQGLVYNNEQGVNEWDATTTYPVDAIVKGSDGALYQAISEQSGNDPISSPDEWGLGIKGDVSSDPDGRYQLIACTLRNTAATWHLLEDANNVAIGVDSVSQNATGITLTLNQAVANGSTGADTMSRCCITATTSPAMANSGVIAGVLLEGAAAGDDERRTAIVQLYGDLEYIVDAGSGTLVSTRSHFPSAVIGVSNSLGDRVQITHPDMGGNPGMVSVTKVDHVGSSSDNTEDVNVSSTGTSTSLFSVGPVDGRIYYDGANWQYEGNMSNAPSPVWNSGANTLVVTHDDAEQYNISVTSRTPGARCIVTSTSTIAFNIQFIDDTGAVITTESTDMDFYVTRKATVRKDNLSGRYAVRAGKARIRPQDIGGTNQDIQIFGLVRSGAITP